MQRLRRWLFLPFYSLNNSSCMKAATQRIPRSVHKYVTGVSEESQRTGNLKYDGYSSLKEYPWIPPELFYPDVTSVTLACITCYLAHSIKRKLSLLMTKKTCLPGRRRSEEGLFIRCIWFYLTPYTAILFISTG